MLCYVVMTIYTISNRSFGCNEFIRRDHRISKTTLSSHTLYSCILQGFHISLDKEHVLYEEAFHYDETPIHEVPFIIHHSLNTHNSPWRKRTVLCKKLLIILLRIILILILFTDSHLVRIETNLTPQDQFCYTHSILKEKLKLIHHISREDFLLKTHWCNSSSLHP